MDWPKVCVAVFLLARRQKTKQNKNNKCRPGWPSPEVFFFFNTPGVCVAGLKILFHGRKTVHFDYYYVEIIIIFIDLGRIWFWKQCNLRYYSSLYCRRLVAYFAGLFTHQSKVWAIVIVMWQTYTNFQKFAVWKIFFFF